MIHWICGNVRLFRQELGTLTFLLLLTVATATAQTFGEITGNVTDSTGGILPGAVVTITNQSTNQARRVETNHTGIYTVPFLVPNVYDVLVESPGFSAASRRGVELQVGAVARIDFALEVGAVTEVVEVVGGAPLLVTESTALGTVIENRRIVELPLNSRNYLQLVALSPNVTAEQAGGGGPNSLQGGERANQAFSIAGQRSMFNHYTLDGVENTDVNFNSFVIRPSIDALQEFKVQTGVYSAEFGRATSQINVTTRAGSNEFHGALFEFLRNDKLDAREWRFEGQSKNPFRRNQFGYTLGGRIIRNKLFFMSNFEALRDSKTLQTTANVPTDKLRAGDFSGQSRAIYDPLTREFSTDAQGNERAISATQFSNNLIPQARFHPVSTKMFEFLPQATVPGDIILRNYVRQSARYINRDQYTQRIDWNESDRSSWFGRYSWGNDQEDLLATFPTNGGSVDTRVYQTMLSNTRTFSPTVVNEFRFGYNQFQNDLVGDFAYVRDVTSELGIKGLPPKHPAAWGPPSFSLTGDGLSGFGGAGTDPFENRNHTFQWLDNVSVIRGKHSLKFGGELRRDRYNHFGNQFAYGSLDFTNKPTFDPTRRSTTGQSFASFLLGKTDDARRSLGLATTMFRATSFYLYIDDTWKVTPKLTLNVGLRYENTPPWHDKYRGIMNVEVFDPGVGPGGLLPKDQTKVPVLIRPGDGDFYEGIVFRFHDGIPTQVGSDTLGRALVLPDKNDFGPRLGVSYTPTQRWTVRTGLGLFYAQDTGNPRFDMGRNLTGRGQFNASEERPNSDLSDPWLFQRQSFPCQGWSGECLGPPQALGNGTHRRTPYVLQWLFNIQHQLAEDVSLEVGYQGNAGHKLERMRGWNQAVIKSGPTDARTIEQRRPWPAYAIVQEVDGSVNSNYHALSGKLQQRFSKGLTYLVGYTWSKSIDNGSAIRQFNGDRLYPANSYDLQAERALSTFHTGRRMVSSVLYELPFGQGKTFGNRAGFASKIIGGWQLGSILTFSDGTPWDVGGLGDRNSTGRTNWPDATGISPFPEQRTTERFWNIAAFDANNPELLVRFGSVGRHALLTPGFRNWDFSVSKNTPIREGHTLQFRFEAFNFPNHPNWNPPNADARNPNLFGIVTSARTMRELQFGMKYVF